MLLVLGLAAVLLAGAAAARRTMTIASTCVRRGVSQGDPGGPDRLEDRMHTRRWMLGALLSPALHRIATAQVAGKVYRVGWLVPSVPTPAVTYRQFLDRATQLGYVEGRTLLIDYRSFDTLDEGKALAAELVRRKVDLIVAQAPPALLAARSATQSVPIVTFFVGDPVRMGIVPSLARPGGNVTGFTWDAGAEGVGMSLQITRELFPRARRFGMLWNQENDSGPFYAREFELLGSSFGLTFVSVGVRTPEEFAPALDRMKSEKVGAVLVFTDPFTIRHSAALSAALGRYRLPALWGSAVSPLQGAVASSSFDVQDQPRRAAEYMDRILKGAAPGELPFQQPTRFQLVVHAKTAREFGVRIPRSVLLRADRIEEQ
ncbi:MAG: ABC transporter substrate-binding protein [Caldimonas sp.]